VARSRRLPQVGRTVSPRRGAQPPTQPPPPPGPSPGKSQGPTHGQGIGIGLFLLSTGRNPGQGGVAPQPAFPHTPILDTFNRADNASLGANWSLLNPGGADGYISTPLGINGNAAYNPTTAGANKSSAYWNVQTFNATQEAYFTANTPPSDWYAVCLRCQNVGGISVKYYFFQTHGSDGAWGINRMDSFSSETSLQSGTFAGFAAGDRIGGRVQNNGSGNPVLTLWVFRAATGLWSSVSSVTDTSGSKITTGGNIGMFIGNLNGSGAGRMDNFGGGNA